MAWSSYTSSENMHDNKIACPPSPTSHTSFSSSSSSRSINPLAGSHAVRYQPGSAWDCVVESGADSIDVALTLPHFRARHQPADHRLNMLIATRSGPVRAQVCRAPSARQAFRLTVVSETEVTLYLPSDFNGTIALAHPNARTAPAVCLSPAFSKDVLPRASFAAALPGTDHALDGSHDAVRVTAPVLNLRVWDVMTASPERKPGGAKSVIKRLLRPQSHATQDRSIDWDFLLD